MKESIAIKVRTKIEKGTYNSKLYYQLGALEEQCQRTFGSSEEVKKEIVFLKKEEDLSRKNLKKIRKEIREELIQTINNEWFKNVNYYELAKLIYAVCCISYESEGYEGLNMNKKRIKFVVEYLNLVQRATNTERDVKKEIQKLILLNS